MFNLEYNGKKLSDYGIYAKELPKFPPAKEKTITQTVSGLGLICERTGEFEPTEFSCQLNYIGKKENWFEVYSELQECLSEEGMLIFSNTPDYYYKIAKVDIGENQMVTERIGTFEVTFTTRDGLRYLKNGLIEHEINEVSLNPYLTSKPVYILSGTGEFELKVNGKKFTGTCEEKLIIDTERQISFGENLLNTSVKGEYDELYLIRGANTIEITEGFTVKIIPNWRRR